MVRERDDSAFHPVIDSMEAYDLRLSCPVIEAIHFIQLRIIEAVSSGERPSPQYYIVGNKVLDEANCSACRVIRPFRKRKFDKMLSAF